MTTAVKKKKKVNKFCEEPFDMNQTSLPYGYWIKPNGKVITCKYSCDHYKVIEKYFNKNKDEDFDNHDYYHAFKHSWVRIVCASKYDDMYVNFDEHQNITPKQLDTICKMGIFAEAYNHIIAVDGKIYEECCSCRSLKNSLSKICKELPKKVTVRKRKTNSPKRITVKKKATRKKSK